jgi:hypothetical protein
MWLSVIPAKGTGYQLDQAPLVTLSGHLHAVRGDRAVLEQLGQIIEMEERMARV